MSSQSNDATEGNFVDVIKTLKREVMEEINLTRNPSTFVQDSYISNRLLFKTPLTENFEEFEVLEMNLLNLDYNKRMVEELCRFKGSCLQSSLSSMLNQLVSRSLLKQFCFKGSKGNNSSGIQKRPFKHTHTYRVITGNIPIKLTETLGLRYLCRYSLPDFQGK